MPNHSQPTSQELCAIGLVYWQNVYARIKTLLIIMILVFWFNAFIMGLGQFPTNLVNIIHNTLVAGLWSWLGMWVITLYFQLWWYHINKPLK